MTLYRDFYIIHQLKAEGLNHSQITRRLNLDRKTVRRYLSNEPGRHGQGGAQGEVFQAQPVVPL